MRNIQSSSDRSRWSQLLGRVEHRGTRYGIVRNGRLVAALVPIDEIELIRVLEERFDLEEAREAVDQARGKPRVSWDDLVAYAGFDE